MWWEVEACGLVAGLWGRMLGSASTSASLGRGGMQGADGAAPAVAWRRVGERRSYVKKLYVSRLQIRPAVVSSPVPGWGCRARDSAEGRQAEAEACTRRAAWLTGTSGGWGCRHRSCCISSAASWRQHAPVPSPPARAATRPAVLQWPPFAHRALCDTLHYLYRALQARSPLQFSTTCISLYCD